MKNSFVMTKNVKKFNSGVEHVNHKLKGIERMLLAIGEPGLGKTRAVDHLIATSEAIGIRALQQMDGRWLMKVIVSELGGTPRRGKKDNWDMIVQFMTSKPRTIIFDEIDRFSKNSDILETLRDIHDVCGCPMGMVGEENAERDLRPNRRLFRRFVDVVRFERLGLDDIRQFMGEVSEVRFEADAIERAAAESCGRISELITLVHKAEAIARANKADKIGARELWKS